MINKNYKFDVWALIDSIFDGLLSYVIDKKLKAPKFIKDIKQEAREIGVKGTKKLTIYLNKKIRKLAILKFSFNSILFGIKAFLNDLIKKINEILYDMYKELRKKIRS